MTSSRSWSPVLTGGRFAGFADAAGAALNQLSRQLPAMDLWLVTCVVDDRQSVVASAGRWADLAPPGTEFSWQASLCVRMVNGQAPPGAPDIAREPAYQRVAVGPLAKVRTYLGVPLQIGDGELFGTLCALGGTPWPDSMDDALASVSLLSRMLSSLIAGERAAHDRSVEAARAYALADRDALTALSNRRGFDNAVVTEHGRGQRFGTRSSIVVITLDDSSGATRGLCTDQDLRRCAEVLMELCQPGDVAARVDGTTFALLAVQVDDAAVRALRARLRHALRASDLPAFVGIATRRPGEDLGATWVRAERASRTDKRRRTSHVWAVR
jgi:diguanylate cyclase